MNDYKPWEHERKGYRTAEEPVDERPPILIIHPFWKDKTEEATYMHAVQANPRLEGESPLKYIRRIAELATKKLQIGAQPMPEARLPYKEGGE